MRELTDWAAEEDLLTERIGFSNARMAYDDMLARVLVTVEGRRLDAKVTASLVTARYREGTPFSQRDVQVLRESMIAVFGTFQGNLDSEVLRPNKATLHTWLCVGAQMARDAIAGGLKELSETVRELEVARWQRAAGEQLARRRAVAVFQDRSTARVADVSSVLLRDLIVWMFLANRAGPDLLHPKLDLANDAWSVLYDLDPEGDLEDELLQFANHVRWGELGWG